MLRCAFDCRAYRLDMSRKQRLINLLKFNNMTHNHPVPESKDKESKKKRVSKKNAKSAILANGGSFQSSSSRSPQGVDNIVYGDPNFALTAPFWWGPGPLERPPVLVLALSPPEEAVAAIVCATSLSQEQVSD